MLCLLTLFSASSGSIGNSSAAQALSDQAEYLPQEKFRGERFDWQTPFLAAGLTDRVRAIRELLKTAGPAAASGQKSFKGMCITPCRNVLNSIRSHVSRSASVRAVRPAFQDAHYLLPKMRDRAILRRHPLKLRYLPQHHPLSDSGLVLDLDWSWIKSMKGMKVGELRIHETIGACDNLRVIFFDPNIREPVPMLWIIAVMQKQRNDFTSTNFATFAFRRQMVLERFYECS